MPLLADPVAERLLDDTELTSNVCHRAVLVDHKRCSVPAELLRVPATSSARRSILIGHHWHAYLLHEVSGQRGDGQTGGWSPRAYHDRTTRVSGLRLATLNSRGRASERSWTWSVPECSDSSAGERLARSPRLASGLGSPHPADPASAYPDLLGPAAFGASGGTQALSRSRKAGWSHSQRVAFLTMVTVVALLESLACS